MSDGIWLARHGETDANAEGRVQGTIDPPLNERGREQARALAREVAPLGLRALYTSQLRRARETAAIVGEALGLEPRVDARFAESWRGEWEGRLIADIKAEDPRAGQGRSPSIRASASRAASRSRSTARAWRRPSPMSPAGRSRRS